MTKELSKTSYKKVIDEISAIYEQAQKTLARAYWEIGKRIVEVEQDGNIRAEYGTNLLENLSKDLSTKYGKGFSVTNMKYMRQFYLNNRKGQAPDQLTCTHYVELLSVEDDQKRKELETEATRKNLTTDELRERIKSVGAQHLEPSSNGVQNIEPLRKPTNLELNVYGFVRKGNPLWLPNDSGRHGGQPLRKQIIDCGFFFYHPTASKHIKIMDKPAFTYKAIVERVIDGDTLWAIIDIGFKNVVREKLRLRGIDTPELGTKEGEAAKKYVTKLLKIGQDIIIKTSKSDLYGRFVADVFYSTTPVRPRDIITKGIYLNQQLLNEGFAKKMM